MNEGDSFESSREGGLSRRDFLKGAGMAGASLLIPPGRKGAGRVFFKPVSGEEAEQPDLSFWEREKRKRIDDLVAGGYVEMIPLADFGRTYKRKNEGLHKEGVGKAVGFLKNEFGLDFEGVGTHWDLMGLAERRYEEILAEGVYSVAVDPTKKETDLFLAKFAGWMAGEGSSEETTDFILNLTYLIASIENGVRGQNPDCHGDHFFPAGGDGPFNPLLDDLDHDGRYWARWIKAKDGQSEQLAVSFRAWDGKAVLKVPAKTARHDFVLNAYVGMAIATEHLLGMAGDSRWQELLKTAVEENPETDKKSVLAASLWSVYHFGRRQFEENFFADPKLVEEPKKIYKDRFGKSVEVGLKFDRAKRWQDRDYTDRGFTPASRNLEFYYNTTRQYRDWVLGKKERDQELALAKRKLLAGHPELVEALEAYRGAQREYEKAVEKEKFNQAQAKFTFSVLVQPELRDLFFKEEAVCFGDNFFESSFAKTAPEKGERAAFSKRLGEFRRLTKPMIEGGERVWVDFYANLFKTEDWADNFGEEERIDYYLLKSLFFDHLPQEMERVFSGDLEEAETSGIKNWDDGLNLNWCLESALENKDIERFLARDPVEQERKRDKLIRFDKVLRKYSETSFTDFEKKWRLGAEVSYLLFQEPRFWERFSSWLGGAFKEGEIDQGAGSVKKKLIKDFPASLISLPEQMRPFWKKGLEDWQGFVSRLGKERSRKKAVGGPAEAARSFLFFDLPRMVEETWMGFSADKPIKLEWVAKLVFAQKMEYFRMERDSLVGLFEEGQGTRENIRIKP